MVHDFYSNEWLKGGKVMEGLNGGALWKEGDQRFWELMAELQGKKIQLYYSTHLPLFPFYCLPEMIWQSLKINEVYSFFPSEFCFEGIL